MRCGDGPTSYTWNRADRTLAIESSTVPALPKIDLGKLNGDPSMDCLAVTGLAGAHDEKPPILVVVSVVQGMSCGTVLGHSYVFAFDGRSWAHLIDSVGGEILLRPDGGEIVEWKLHGAPEVRSGGAWTRTPRTKFPPPGNRATPATMSGLIAPGSY